MSVTFIKTASRQDIESAIEKRLTIAIESSKRVLWIVTGGSNIALAVNIMAKIPKAESAKLAIVLSDERFGPVDFPDSNFRQLYMAGFAPKHATVVPVLRPAIPLAETTEIYNLAVAKAFAAAGTVIALLGMGADGHVAGILPGSVAVKPSKKWVTSYEAADFTRITLTPFALSHVAVAFLVANGKSKQTPLLSLRDKSLTVAKQPAQLLKKLPELIVFNDQIGDKL